MPANSFGEHLVLTSFGESHGAALGAVIDGCPAGIPLTEEHVASALRRRRPGQSSITSPRAERDVPEILSGVFEEVTLGTPICVIVRNLDARSDEYSAGVYRPGHADRVWEEKFGIRDYRGGGRSSGRETLARVIGGVVAERLLPPGVRITAYTHTVADISAAAVPDDISRSLVDQHPTRCPDSAAATAMHTRILEAREKGDSLGGVIELRIDGAPAGLGEPVFRKAKSLLAGALMSIGAVTGVSLGDAFEESALPGSAFHAFDRDTAIPPLAHGIQGGITNGDRILLRIAVKPPATLGSMTRRGRHDPCILPRLVPVAEAMTALVLADLSLAARMNRSA